MTAIRFPLPSRWRRASLARREALFGYAFLSPWLIGFLALTLIPMVATLIFTFTNINLAQEEPIQFVGLRNYERLLGDPRVWQSIRVTLLYAVISLPVGIIVPFSVALLLNSRSLRGSSYFRVLFFLPYVVPFVAGVLIWGGMLNTETGWLNGALRFIGIANPPNWVNSPDTIYPALVLIGIWGIGAGIIINLAGLAGIPTELYDAAYIDGAGFWASLRHVTLPLMTPVIFYTLVLGIVEVFQYFLVPLVLNNGTGDPGGSTFFYNLYLYKEFFTYQNMSYGATLAWVLFLMILAITVALFLTARRWVYYAGER
jgi:ABC-type sugar transport system permease subunit